MKILLVDDSPEATWLLSRSLVEDDHQVEIAHSGAEGLRLAHSFQPDLILLDVVMPGMDGWTTLSRIREFSDVPIIMLTAVGDEQSMVRGLDSGADDYLTKPFSAAELKARIRALLRRAVMPPPGDQSTLEFDGGQLLIDPLAREVTVRGEVVELTPTEYRLLLFLAVNAGQVLTPEQILEQVWGPGYEDARDHVKLYIWYLRRKIEVRPTRPRYIHTKRGVGYYLSDT